MSKKNLLLAAVACLLGTVAVNGSSAAFAKATGGRGCAGCAISAVDSSPVALEKATGGRGCAGCAISK